MEKMTLPEYYMVYGQQELAPGTSEVEKLMNEFEAHEEQEAKFVRRYKEIAQKSENPLVKYLLELIVADEEKHHAIAHAITSTLRRDLTWRKQENAIDGLYDLRAEKDELLKLTGDFIRLEKHGVREYKSLMHVAKGYYGGLFALLFQIMLRDSEKHIAMLEYLRGRLKEA